MGIPPTRRGNTFTDLPTAWASLPSIAEIQSGATQPSGLQIDDRAPQSRTPLHSVGVHPKSRGPPTLTPTLLLQTAVAGTLAPTSAGPRIFGLEHFRSFVKYTDTYKQHNLALKFFRDTNEASGIDQKNFSNTLPEEVAEILHDTKGPLYRINAEVTHAWNWQEMVAQLDDESMRFVVEGDEAADPQNRSRGLVSCCIRQSGKYDHKRHHAHKGGENMKTEWDFVLGRADGTSISLHPNYGNTTASWKYGFSAVPDRKVPRTGLGGSDGPGTFQRLINKGVDKTLRFDPTKAPEGKGKGQGKGKAKAKAKEAPQSRPSAPPPASLASSSSSTHSA